MKTAMAAATTIAKADPRMPAPAWRGLLPVLAIGSVLALIWSPPALAQKSASYSLEEHTLNAGGRPFQGAVLSSASYRMSLDAIGDSLAGTGLSSASYVMGGGFTAAYPPPGEVTGLFFMDTDTLVWDPETSVGVYNLYRAPLSDLPGLQFGVCAQQGLSDETATDATVPAAGSGFFYLATAENALAEEGTKGFQSNGIERQGWACP